MNPPEGFVPPPYPYDRLGPLHEAASRLAGGAVDLSVGTPSDPPPSVVVEALVAAAPSARSYPPSIGTDAYRRSAAGWMARRLGVEVPPDAIAATVGTKELVAGVPHLLRLRRPDLDTVLYPSVSYPSYAMGALLAGCRAVAVPCDDAWRLDLGAVDERDAARALCLWVNSPGNPAGALDDLGAAARWGRERGVTVLSDECYVEFTWAGEPATILEAGPEGVLAVHSLSKRSNLAGARAGCYAGDPELVGYLGEVRKHLGLMVPGPTQAAAVATWADDAHVDAQRAIYHRRLERLVELLEGAGLDADLPEGSFYLWVPAPGADAWALAGRLAEVVGAVVSPGEFYGDAAAGFVRIAAVPPDDRLDLLAERFAAAGEFV